MFSSLNTGAIGIRNISLEQSLALAQRCGYGGVDLDISEAVQLAGAHGAAWLRELFVRYEMRPGNWFVPDHWQGDYWETGEAKLRAAAQLAQELGALRATTWCPPHSPTRNFDENFEWHRLHYTRVAETLLSCGIRFGIEYIGPKSYPPPGDHLFIQDMAGMLRLCEAIGTSNVGLMLDAWHVHSSGGSMSDLDKLTNELIVAVHVNDAPAGVSLADYDDYDRRLPTESGVIDLAGFMQRLDALGYDGPVTCEPFSQRVNALEDPLEAAQVVAAHMQRMWQQAGLEWA